MEKMKLLYDKVAGDSVLQTKFNEIMSDGEKSGEAATEEMLVTFAKEAGYEVSIAEMKAFFKDLTEKKEGELSDMELDAVAGGKGGIGVLVSIAGGGIGCGITSAIAQVSAGNCTDLLNSDTGQTW